VKELEFHFWASSSEYLLPMEMNPDKFHNRQLDWGFWAAIGSAQNNLHGWF
jgi:hypothetical protein